MAMIKKSIGIWQEWWKFALPVLPTGVAPANDHIGDTSAKWRRICEPDSTLDLFPPLRGGAPRFSAHGALAVQILVEVAHRIKKKR